MLIIAHDNFKIEWLKKKWDFHKEQPLNERHFVPLTLGVSNTMMRKPTKMSKSSSSLAKILDSQWIEFDDNSSDEKAAATEEVALNGDPDDYDNNVLKNKKVEEQVLEFET